MRGKALLLLILLYAAVSRIFLIGKIPLLFAPNVISGRLFSAGISLASIVVLFILTKRDFRNTKIALLTSWVFSILPWVFEQSRINSPPNLAVGMILLILYLRQKTRSKLKPVFLLFIPVAVFLLYPQFWLFKTAGLKFSINSFVNNLFIIFSFDLLFFSNITFWWGGIRDFGIMFLSFFPFFLVGIYQLIIQKKCRLLLLLMFIAVISALSPYFPESREFYLVVPIISIITALGIYRISSGIKISQRLIICCLFFLLTYEIAQFFHFYFVHYPQQVVGNSFQIHEPF